MIVLAIDPGPQQSAWCWYDGHCLRCGIDTNEALLDIIPGYESPDVLAVEMIASYGMAVGAEVFQTCVWIGRFVQAWDRKHILIPRLEVKMHLCHDSRAKDTHIRQALIDRFGAPGTKRAPGRTYGLRADMWAALAVAVTCAEKC